MTSRCDITRVFWDPDTVCTGESVSVCVVRAVTPSLSLFLRWRDHEMFTVRHTNTCDSSEGVAVDCGLVLSLVDSCVWEVSSAVLDG